MIYHFKNENIIIIIHSTAPREGKKNSFILSSFCCLMNAIIIMTRMAFGACVWCIIERWCKEDDNDNKRYQTNRIHRTRNWIPAPSLILRKNSCGCFKLCLCCVVFDLFMCCCCYCWCYPCLPFIGHKIVAIVACKQLSFILFVICHQWYCCHFGWNVNKSI